MTHQVTLTISDHLMKRARYLAQRQSRKAEDVLADAIVLDEDHEIIDWTEPNVELEREKNAYLAMHAELQRTMGGKHVAILDGKLVDHDDDFDQLVTRIRVNYPRRIVWLTTVEAEPIGTIHMRSPRFLPQ